MVSESFITVTVIAFLGMLSPGPDFFLVAKNALRYSRKTALATALGINLGVAVHVSYCIFGVAYMIQNTPWLFATIKYMGASYLIFLGVQCLQSTGAMRLDQGEYSRRLLSPLKGFFQGWFCNLLNPKAMIFFLSLFTQVIDAKMSASDKVGIGAMILTLGFLYWPMVVLCIQSAVVKLFFQRSQKILDRVFGGVLIVFGIKVAVT